MMLTLIILVLAAVSVAAFLLMRKKPQQAAETENKDRRAPNGCLLLLSAVVLFAGGVGFFTLSQTVRSGYETARSIGYDPVDVTPWVTLWTVASAVSFLVSIVIFIYANRASSSYADWLKGQFARMNANTLRQFGENADIQVENINALFDHKNYELVTHLQYNGTKSKGLGANVKAKIGRSLSSMSPRDREVLRSALILYARGLNRDDYNTWMQILALTFGDGKGTIYGGATYSGIPESAHVKNFKDVLAWVLSPDNTESAVNLVLAEIAEALNNNPNDPDVRILTSRVLGDGGDMSGGGFLQPLTDLSQPTETLILGEDERDPSRLMAFNGQGSLITIAPPRSGKTQSHVIPNLLNWPGPAVVLDIKGEIFDTTSGWRAANVGPVYRFDPLNPNPAKTNSYNPLLAVSDDPEHIWEDSRFLADMLIVPSGKAKDPFWESRARDVLTAAIAVTVRDNPPEERGMGKVLDILHGVGWEGFIMGLTVASDVPTMVRTGKSLGEMDTKMRDSVLQTALASMSAWEGTRIARATATSDWQPLDLRSGRNPTVYICIAPNQIDSYVSMLRVIIAQHIRALTAALPEQQSHPILFVLDELPRLRHMPPVEEALEIGAQYGIKLWMFAQNVGQLETAYENADGMMASCAVRMFMNPALQDGTAQKLSDDMGCRESVIDGTRVKRVEANVLAGPEFKDMVIVMASSAEPARVRKHFAHADPELSRRMQMPAAGAEE